MNYMDFLLWIIIILMTIKIIEFVLGNKSEMATSIIYLLGIAAIYHLFLA
jgi:uncharacterized membrane protein YuzA (DUF378 family)